MRVEVLRLPPLVFNDNAGEILHVQIQTEAGRKLIVRHAGLAAGSPPTGKSPATECLTCVKSDA